MAFIRSLLYALFLAITVIPYAVLSLLWSPLPQRQRYRLTTGWARLAIWGARVIVGIRWQVIGSENFPNGRGIVLAKHQSAWETLFLPAHLPREACFVYKKELHYIPFFGWGLATLRMIPINRSKGKDAFEQIVRIGRQRLEEGRWPTLFPEGTRVPPGKMGRFKAGGAKLAERTGAPVIPIAHNAGSVWPRNAFIKKPGLITVSVGPLIQTEGKSADAINQEARAWIEQEMQRLESN
ncbi:1-acyl-sn-glycerol-3-phosphate acyltransferase [Pusillimonas sp. CC-YST705]|uniref:1-acyl-sn-glycerol-3-phosphate acyltransferase n=1 Tax=Mesopusillimonas faecipullorum TaxID=2755040 RepID=A0ABS8C8Z9_9BURK|nr:lysophospholipid acyltransferase family protein [Mesopusillimonas faecipullorum]MCB5362504.1 1-acyl-sn-glycerol-3-phosphate acyltransferase [Mesopusillimonas faecipullorum]